MVAQTMASSRVPVPVTLLQMCTDFKEIRQLHARLVVSGLIDRRVNAGRLIASYVACGEIYEALSVFHTIPYPDVFAYNNIIRGLTLAECPHDSLLLYIELLQGNLTPDNHTYTYVLKACSRVKAVSEGKQLHAQIIKVRKKPDGYIHGSMINMYANSGEMDCAERVLAEFSEDNVHGKNSVITGYMNRGKVYVARQVFNNMSTTDSASWSAMITGYARNGMHTEALVMFQEMTASKVVINEPALVSALSACGHLGALDQGRWIHAYVNKNTNKISVNLGTSIIDMYARCGCVEFGYEVFKSMPERDVVTWGVIIHGFATHGLAEKCFQLFDEMVADGTQPNEVIYVAILTTCSHAGLVDLGRLYFNQMSSLCNIRPSIEHYGCMVDLLGRAGRLAEAEELISTMVEEPNVVIWGALLAGCRIHKDFRLGEYAFRQLVKLEPDSGERYKLASHLLADRGERERAHKLRKEIQDRNLEVTQGLSLIEIDGEIHEFVASDIDHKKYQEIYSVFQGHSVQ
ncbi:putative tetratricopeptide-like helical domain superfamily [Helianthus annuus]|uniref:Putative tetratricopeptide-like helical domain-containing protein n=1 Tax=Helianthus annuus TaxID=4232 RepID=A0A251SAW0_HELAN|nr:pentatricopeptide repeat-containing protein At5g66520-like [Helianthus annuus]KAF5781320.1 putative tetratricopeptide-like helical domain superfamily [Helianthus annuus]KAJ0500950.1 putative tetratricopeptide-like helical domain superfamily [Helianthus annuus]KAJ0508605.1 putative tetratricopeptide-like helical domain superfamily [Helianthus annuus]KAJ0516840.1 putative tetratricopeptide-like helical domain superfamily [Helianthus annuus]KAJ0684845.1 putative tetratricopeptide-like helical 